MYTRARRLPLAAAILALTGCGAAAPRPTAPVVLTGAPGESAMAAAAADPANPTASIRGVVVAAPDRAPIARARVIASAVTLADPRVTITAPDGSFAFTKLPAGAYTLSVSRTGFVSAEFGERRSAASPPVPVNAGETVTGIEIPLQRAGAIAGQILDEDDTPFAGATVDALLSRTVDGRTAFVSVASAQTDDRGEFRLAGLPAGQFYLSAFDPAFGRAGDETGSLKYSPTYFPGVSFAEQATRVTVAPGADPQHVVFKLHIIRPAAVSGRIRTPDARQLTSGAVVMRPIHEEALAVVPSQDVRILPDGTFTFRNVPPGQYQIRARGDVGEDAPSLFATFNVRVEGHDIANVDMTLVPGARVEGRLVVEGSKRARSPQLLAGIRVRAPFVDGSTFGDALTGDVRPDGTYAIRGLMTGTHILVLEGLPAPWVLKSVTWRGQDVTDAGIPADSQETYSDVRLTITDVASEVRGTVRDMKGTPVADATVILIPSAQQFWTRTSRRFRLLRSDASGRYSVRGLPAGEYRAVASIQVDDSEAYRREVLEQLSQAGAPVSTTDLAAQALDLTLTAAPRIPQTTSR